MSSRRKRFPAGIAAAVLLIVLLALFLAGPEYLDPAKWWAGPSRAPASGELAIHFFDVGQGDAILIQAPAQNVLIDGGPRGAGADLARYLVDCGIKRLDLVIATHPHEDHIGGLLTVLDQITVEEVMDPAVPHTAQTYEKFLMLIDEKEIRFTSARAGMSRDLGGGAVLTLLHPADSDTAAGLNDCSIVVRLAFGRVSFLFTGDAEAAAEREMLRRGGDIRCTILKVAHHGSSSSTGEAFLDAVKPESAIICYGSNQYGLPHPDTLDKLAAAGVTVYSTFEHGTIIIMTDGDKYTVNPDRNGGG